MKAQRNFRGEDMLGGEASVDVLKTPQRLDQQAGSHQQHQR